MEAITPKPRKRPTKIEEMSKDQIRQAILKKRECNAKAQQIVESLLESCVTDTYLLQCLPDINQTHFQDIIEERSIIHLCGYPLCPKTLSVKDIPKQKYRISLKTNKVYDITARKNFCSNNCYSAAMYVNKQLLTSPLWFREYEDIPKFHLLKVENIGGMGEEVDVTLVDRVKITEKKSFTSINDFTQASLVDVPDNALDGHDNGESTKQLEIEDKVSEKFDDVTNEINKLNIKESNDSNKTTIPNDLNINVTESSNQVQTILQQEVPKPLTEKSNKKPVSNPLNIVGEIIEKPERKIDPILTATLPQTKENKATKKTKVLQKKQPLVTALTIEVEKCLAEWFTLDTMLLLFGDEKVREMVADKGECIKEYLNNYAKGIFYSSNAYDQYQALCKKLNMLELEDKKFDSDTLKRETKPLPSYRMLQEESKKMQLKVKAFFSGETEIPEPEIEETVQTPTEEENTTNLPLVDKNSQNALRRRIVCQHLNKVLPDLLRSLGLLSLQISADVRLLVNTFKLKANNIMFKPIQWTLIAIIFIKLLSLRDKRLEYLLEQPTAYQHMQLLLLSYKQDGGYLDRLICWLTDIDRLLDTNDTQLTVE
ncbi:putative RNA polymerase II subunit B1 CTD phosphatase RPAP2 [Anticarsia gemmatalis]|uniref:putative RNA polymerase II subunit B1 CTD phosphatase RPAP2 n=1 Tax=Anticarsia gemmatalis TaxID=129554 RepID=UPI003F77709B